MESKSLNKFKTCLYYKTILKYWFIPKDYTIKTKIEFSIVDYKTLVFAPLACKGPNSKGEGILRKFLKTKLDLCEAFLKWKTRY